MLIFSKFMLMPQDAATWPQSGTSPGLWYAVLLQFLIKLMLLHCVMQGLVVTPGDQLLHTGSPQSHSLVVRHEETLQCDHMGGGPVQQGSKQIKWFLATIRQLLTHFYSSVSARMVPVCWCQLSSYKYVSVLTLSCPRSQTELNFKYVCSEIPLLESVKPIICWVWPW